MRQLIPLSAGAISSVAASFNIPGAGGNMAWNTSATNVSGLLVVSGRFTKIYSTSAPPQFIQPTPPYPLAINVLQAPT